MPANEIELYVDTTMRIIGANLRNDETGALVTGATVTMRVLDSAGTVVTGTADPITMTEVVGSSGLYVGVVPNTASLSLSNRGTIVITATDGVNVLTCTLNYVVTNKS